MTYLELKEASIGMEPHIKWDDIHVGEIYLIPKIGVRSAKVILVTSKSEIMLQANEVDEEDKLSNYTTVIYKSDVETKFIVNYHKF